MLTPDAPMLGRVARLHYENGLTHNEIGDVLGFSRVKVTRLLAEARRVGIVEIRIHADTHTFVELESRLVRKFGLVEAWVVPASADHDRQFALLAIGAAHALEQLVTPGMTVAVGASRAVSEAPPLLKVDHQVNATFVPLVGSRGGLTGVNAHATSGAFARAFGGKAHDLPAPILTRTPEAATVLFEEPKIANALRLAAKADMLVAGIGGTSADIYLVSQGEISHSELEEIVNQGAVGDLSCRFFDRNGAAVAAPFNDRVIGLSLEELRSINQRIGVAGGISKRQAARAAVSGGIINILVTDVDTATWLAGEV